MDTFAETRENDVVNLAQEMEFSMEDDQQILKQIFRRTCVSRCSGMFHVTWILVTVTARGKEEGEMKDEVN